MHRFIAKHARIILSLIALLVLGQYASAQVIPTYITVERIGTGAAGLTSAATDVFLDRYDATTAGQGSPLGTITFPTTVSGSNRRLTDTGSGTSAGQFTRYVNGQGYAVPGYDAALATPTVATTSPATVNRVIGNVNSSFAVDTQTGYSNGGSFNFRSVASVDGSSFYGTTSSATDGIIYVPSAGSIGSFTQIFGANSRVVRIFNNSLFYSTSSATAANNGVFLLGTAGTLPTASATSTQLPGLGASGTGTPNSWGFYMFDNPLNSNNWNGTGLDTLYFADERSTANGGGLQRWVYDGTTWNLTGTFASPARGLTATIDVSGLVSIWYTTVETSANTLSFTQDALTATGGAFTSRTILATAAANTVFRGVDLGLMVSVPEPSTYAFIGLTGFFGLQWYLRRKGKNDKTPASEKQPQTAEATPTETVLV